MDLIETPCFSPAGLLDAMIQMLGLKNSAALADRLGVHPALICKVRSGQLPVGASLLIRMHEESGLHVKELRRLLGDRRLSFRMANRGWHRDVA